jgi:hypothetical protein
VTAIDPTIPMTTSQPRGSRVVDFLDRLSHPKTAPARASGPIFAAIRAVVSLGILPLFFMPAYWNETVDRERLDFRDLIGWWRRRVAPADAAELDRISLRLRPKPIFTVLCWVIVGSNLALMGILLTQGDNLQRLWELTFKHAQPSGQLEFADGQWRLALPMETLLYRFWVISLSVGYFIQWYAARTHVVAVDSLVQWTNKLARENKYQRIKSDVLKIGLTPLWIVLGIALCVMHGWWAIPMVFAGAMQRRYALKSSPAIRIALASQARDAYAIVQSSGDRFCSAEHCAARLPAPARFCPRCGTAV